MLQATFIGLAVVASLSLGALSPALAAYGHCVEQPDAADCRTYNMPGLPPARLGRHPCIGLSSTPITITTMHRRKGARQKGGLNRT